MAFLVRGAVIIIIVVTRVENIVEALAEMDDNSFFLKILYIVAIAIFVAIYPFFISMIIECFQTGMKGAAFFSRAG